jgi:SnoaL-like domain
MTADPRLTALVAKQDIRDALSRYCRAMDRRDEALAASTWHADGTADYGPIFQGSGAGFAAWVTEIHGNFARHSHQITNVLIHLDDACQNAVSEAYVTVALWSAPLDTGGVTQATSRGRYLDRWSYRDGRWAISARQFVDDVTVTQVLAAAEVAPMDPASRRDTGDPSYALLDSYR